MKMEINPFFISLFSYYIKRDAVLQKRLKLLLES